MRCSLILLRCDLSSLKEVCPVVQPNQNNTFFQPNKNCWRINRAKHVSLLIDCANFYRALHRAITNAQHSIFILGWEIDSQTRLLRGEEEKKSTIPSIAVELLNWKAHQNSEIKIYLSRWDASVVFIKDRDLLPEFVWTSNTPENVHICLDGQIPMGGSQHQKVILIDDELVFTGGMDIARQRWDEREHRIIEPERQDILGPYGPYHDVQIMMDGPITLDFAELVRERWKKAVDYNAIPIRPITSDNLINPVPSWPSQFKARSLNIECSISRTIPRLDEQEPVQEIRQMYLDLIAQAQNFIYIENQFLTSEEIARALNQRLTEQPQLKVLLVSSYEPQGVFERESFWAGRIDFKKILEKNISTERVRLTYPCIKDVNGNSFFKRIHSKVLVVDDTFLTIASSNLNHRSLILDSECDISLMAESAEQKKFISSVRNDLIAEHTSHNLKQVAEILDGQFSLDQLISAECFNGYALYEVDDTLFTDQNFKSVLNRIADPEQPLMSYFAVNSLDKAAMKMEPFTNPRKHRLIFFTILIFSLIGIFVYLKSHLEWFHPERIKVFLEYAQTSRFSLPLVCLIYVVGGFVLFPVTILSLITATVFGSLLGPLYGMVGSLISATVMFWLGHWAGLNGLRNLFGERIRSIDRKFHKSGIVGVAALRFIPIAPYSLVNLVAGISSITFFDFIVGTFLGFLPGLLVKGFVGQSLTEVLINPTPTARLDLFLGIILWLSLAIASYFLARLWRTKHPL